MKEVSSREKGLSLHALLRLKEGVWFQDSLHLFCHVHAALNCVTAVLLTPWSCHLSMGCFRLCSKGNFSFGVVVDPCRLYNYNGSVEWQRVNLFWWRRRRQTEGHAKLFGQHLLLFFWGTCWSCLQHENKRWWISGLFLRHTEICF